MVSLSLGKRRRILMSKAEKTEEDKKLIDQWLAKGNKVGECDPHARTDPDDIIYTFKVGKRGKKAKES